MLTDGDQLTTNSIRNIVGPERETVDERTVVKDGVRQSHFRKPLPLLSET